MTRRYPIHVKQQVNNEHFGYVKALRASVSDELPIELGEVGPALLIMLICDKTMIEVEEGHCFNVLTDF